MSMGSAVRGESARRPSIDSVTHSFVVPGDCTIGRLRVQATARRLRTILLYRTIKYGMSERRHVAHSRQERAMLKSEALLLVLLLGCHDPTGNKADPELARQW